MPKPSKSRKESPRARTTKGTPTRKPAKKARRGAASKKVNRRRTARAGPWRSRAGGAFRNSHTSTEFNRVAPISRADCYAMCQLRPVSPWTATPATIPGK